MPDIKRCSRCGETKTLDQFHRRLASADGRQGRCRACVRDDVSAWARVHPERRREIARESARRRRDPPRAKWAAIAAANAEGREVPWS